MIKVEKYVKQKNFQRHFNYFIEMFNIGFKLMKEYKINTYSMIIVDFFLLFSSMVLYFIVDDLTNEFLAWNIGDFFLFFCFNLLMWKFLWLHNLRDIRRILISRELNQYLVRPINPYFQINSNSINGQNFISGIGLFLVALVFSLMQNYSNYFFAFLYSFFGFIYFILFFNFLQSFYFFMKTNNIYDIISNFESITRKFTPKVFDNLSLSLIFYLTPVSVASYFTIEILNNRFEQFYFYLPYIIFTSIIFGLGIYFQWKIGLKKYEAFG